jgi:hypothetical protein
MEGGLRALVRAEQTHEKAGQLQSSGGSRLASAFADQPVADPDQERNDQNQGDQFAGCQDQ